MTICDAYYSYDGKSIELKIDYCEFPDDLLYDLSNGTWGRPDSGTLRVGITNLLSWPSGTFSVVTFKGVGTSLLRGQVAGSVEGPMHFDVVRTPVSGVILRTNEVLKQDPRLLNKDPYGSGWFMEVEMKNPTELLLMQKLPEAREQIAARLRELRVHCFAEFPDHEMFEIGVECSAVLVKLNNLLDQNSSGTVVHVVSDDNSAPIEMERWSDQTGNRVLESRREGNLYHFIAKKT
ncbi:MAG: sulfurtransferase TusA family protein [Nitrososphaerales archaeon]|jgi:glycine cleavage system H lipoate-binding protein/TusA-related sulfurtransferase